MEMQSGYFIPLSSDVIYLLLAMASLLDWHSVPVGSLVVQFIHVFDMNVPTHVIRISEQLSHFFLLANSVLYAIKFPGFVIEVIFPARNCH